MLKVFLYRAMPKEEDILGKKGPTRKVEPEEETFFFPNVR